MGWGRSSRTPHLGSSDHQFVYRTMTALSMAVHPRLGASSPARVLPPELIRHICRFVADADPPPRSTTAVQKIEFLFGSGQRSARSSSIIRPTLAPSDRQRACHVLDVNGADRTERRKWFSAFFDDVHVVFFVLDLTSYDRVNDRGENMMDESLLLWEHVCNHPCFRARTITQWDEKSGVPRVCKIHPQAQFVVFLNKHDLFEAKLKETGGMGAWSFAAGQLGDDYTECLQFMVDAVRVRNKSWELSDPIILATSATDSTSMAGRLSSVQEVMIQVINERENEALRPRYRALDST